MKLKFFVVSKKTILIVLAILFCLAFFLCCCAIRPTFQPSLQKVIVIDAGHGGIDGGCTGINTKVKESDLNLKYAKKLQKLCQEMNFEVVMTRSNEDGLYEPFAKNKKKSEMEKREKIIKQSHADLFVSIHMNSLSNKTLKGAQVFYKKDNIEAQSFADSITAGLKSAGVVLRGESKVGDYYVLNCHDKAGVLIECGFLSSPEDEKNLMSEDYSQKVCNGILKGILSFLNM